MNNLKGKTTINGYEVFYTDNLREAKANISSGLISPTDKLKINNLSNEKIISTQAEFDSLFSTGSIPENTFIFLKNKGTPYLFNTNSTIYINSNVRIISDGAIVNRGYANSVFATTYKATYQISSGEKGSNTLYLVSGTFSIGDFLIDNVGRTIGRVIDANGTTITLLTPLQTTYLTSNYAMSCIENIYFDGWIFDGQNNVNGAGGSLASLTDGGFASLNYCANSTFKSLVRNCSVSRYGGAYYGGAHEGHLYNNTIENITNCEAGSGGACYNCNYSIISNIYHCSATNGGGCYRCNYSSISNINYCSAGTGGGGCNNCYYCNILNINYCSAANGGGCYGCNYSSISNINYCSAGGAGGGLYNCLYSIVSNINYCSAANSGGGCYLCNYSDFYPPFSNNSAPSYPNIAGSTYGLCWVSGYTENGTRDSTAINF